MLNARVAFARALPVILLWAIYWPALTTWFYQDDFGWLNLRHDVHSVSDLPRALFAPKAHGNMRPLGENAYWLIIPTLFGADPLPFHIATFLTQSASLLLLGGIAQRLGKSLLAAFAAQILWIANLGFAETLGWSSIYNQALSGFFFLLAFYSLIRYAETGARSFWIAQWAAFVLGLGALETNVMYPALAAVYALLFARPLFRKVLPMFAVSVLAALVHWRFAPPSASGVYAPILDARVFSTFWDYWRLALGRMPLWLAIFLTAAVCLLALSAIRRRKYAVLLGLAWFVIPLVPYLLLPDHEMNYYLAVPALGIALLGAEVVGGTPWSAADPLVGLPGKERVQGDPRGPGGPPYIPSRILAAVCLLIYLGASAPRSALVARWQHARGERMENLVLGVREVRQSAPRAIVLLGGIDTDTFFSGLADLPFRALSIPHVYLAADAFDHIQAPRELLSKYVLPPAIARPALDSGAALLYRFDGQMLHRAAAAAVPYEDEPRFINIADDVFLNYLGPGWSAGTNGLRSMRGTAALRIGGPRNAADRLYIGVFETHDFRLRVAANGVELPVELASRNMDLSEYSAALPPAALARKVMQISLIADKSPLLFGYVEVR